ncbi:hypothetical protein HispidOSU_011685, partial [Sigmodon hispidus]
EGQPSAPDGLWPGELSTGQMSGQSLSEENPTNLGPSNICASYGCEETRAGFGEPTRVIKQDVRLWTVPSRQWKQAVHYQHMNKAPG